MGLYHRWKPILSPGEKVPLSPGLLSVSHDVKNNKVGRESMHRIGVRGGPNPEWFHQE